MKKKCIAVILAAGQGKRMGTQIRKQYLELCSRPVLCYTVKAFEQSDIIDEIILVTGKGEKEYVRTEIVGKYRMHKVSKIIEGGKERYDSVWNALSFIEEHYNTEHMMIFIHDGARPFADDEMIRRTYEAAGKYGACVAGMPVKDTIKIVNEEKEAIETPNRQKLWMVQTPQVFTASLIIEAYKKMMEVPHDHVTDDAMAVETMMGYPVKLVEGSYENIKITTPEDMEIAEVFVRRKKLENI
nr:2-C-methyl-D-erythritol 4-phosphate cytidylyltransferase [uncultured Sellimonas sp.]